MAGLTQRQQDPIVAPDPQDALLLEPWKQRHANAARDRRRYEPIWQVCQAFVQNRQWIGWDFRERRIVQLPNPSDRERVTVNVITQYLWTVYGKLTADDFRPDLTFRKDDVEGQAYARQAQRSVEYGWDEEFEADESIMEAILKLCTFGTSGLQLIADPMYGPVIGDFPVDDSGRMILDLEQARAHVSAKAAAGETASFRTAREGRLCYRARSPFEILPPPGVENERDFPWIIFESPTTIDRVKAAYGAKANNLHEESLRAIDMIGVREAYGPDQGAMQSGDLKGHVMLKRGFEVATPEHPYGRSIVWAQNTVLDAQDRLPFVVQGMGKIGWVPLHYHKVPGRFWSIGVTEPLLGAQKHRNRSRSQWIEMKDRAGLGRVYAHKGVVTSVNQPKGGVFELVEILPGHEFPKETQGVPPGPWIAQDVDMHDSDMNKAAGIQDVSLSNAPQGLSAYAALSLLVEQDDKRVGPVLKDIRFQIAKLVKVTLAGMKEYWNPQKLVATAGENELLDTFIFNASKLPDNVLVKIGSGAPLPQSQSAQIQMIFDIFDRAISAGQVLPLDWLADSLKAGQALPLPKRDEQVAVDKAQLENLMMRNGQLPQVAPYDNDELHVQQHRQAELQWTFIPELQQALQLLQVHIQQHLQSAQMKSLQAVQPTNPGGTPNRLPQGNGRDAGFGPQINAQQQGLLGRAPVVPSDLRGSVQ